ncbi:MAG TPA: hypothetical protein VHC69_06570 [Polyangiaceae bacterium]|nr:hypothetical protein [Polyangiaceae bacterium]
MPAPEHRARVASRSTSAVAVLAAALVPKCPLCVVAMLTALGLSSAWATFLGGVARPFVFALAGMAIALVGFFELRRFTARLRSQRSTSCCARS